jgi:hypothetical protein
VSAHTPGPWHAWQQPIGEEWAVTTDADVPPYGMPVRVADKIETAANARLIAAAPELLASVVEEVEYFDSLMASLDPGDVGLREASMRHHGPRIARARAAVAKAKGGAT